MITWGSVCQVHFSKHWKQWKCLQFHWATQTNSWWEPVSLLPTTDPLLNRHGPNHATHEQLHKSQHVFSQRIFKNFTPQKPQTKQKSFNLRILQTVNGNWTIKTTKPRRKWQAGREKVQRVPWRKAPLTYKSVREQPADKWTKDRLTQRETRRAVYLELTSPPPFLSPVRHWLYHQQ